jgi:hypothetical protein
VANMMRFAAREGAAYSGSNERARILVRSPRAMDEKRDGTKGRSASTEAVKSKFFERYGVK